MNLQGAMAKSSKAKKRRRKSTGFYDLNLLTEGTSHAERVALAVTSFELGYSGIAFNHVVKGSLSDAHACKSRCVDLSAIVSADPGVAQSAHFHRDVLGVPPARRSFRQYNRLTITIETAIQTNAVNAANPVIRSYDIIAVRPTSQKAFDQACAHLEVDLICLDFLHRMPLRLSASSVQAAVQRGVFFEISFSGVLQDVKARRELFANTQILKGLTKGQNIIFTSGARRPMELRGPNDVANLATLLGLSREAAKLSITRNCEVVIVNCLSRKTTYKSAVIVEKIQDWELSKPDDTWFEVPKFWDPLSVSKSEEDQFLLPEKMKSMKALEITTDREKCLGEQEGKVDQVSEQGLNSAECFESIPQDDEDNFLSIDFTNAVKSPSGGDVKAEREMLAKLSKHLGKSKKRKR
ncbi:hypothetical protein KP509_11G091300 [Ceratopteris richardii]|uniref:Uncharacterized protein n=1 Tax=Ceratopteris richardii TaxID=49495 RepID=A0A8T2U0M4_CERRI|nr:hypothetical protein KP509_11G091300 [Ceratopteris richardii]